MSVPSPRLQLSIRPAALLLALAAVADAAPLDLRLPTDNLALYRGDGPAFYQYVERDFRGVKSRPWQGGQYGFVRHPVEWGKGVVFTRFHEGIDIRPLRRDPEGTPLDEVRAIADGRVVHASTDPRLSNYGRFVVVEHNWTGGPFYSLYAHLRSVGVAPGQTLAAGQRLGMLGWSGDGLDLDRAHLHLEIALRLSDRFEEWHAAHFPSEPNHHGPWNGLNLAGIDVAGFYLAHRRRPDLTLPEFLATQPVVYRARIPASLHLSLLRRYPWLIRQPPGPGASPPKSWEIGFTPGGVPVSAVPSDRPVPEPEATWVAPPRSTLLHATRGQVTGTVDAPRLTEAGRRSLRLLTFPD